MFVLNSIRVRKLQSLYNRETKSVHKVYVMNEHMPQRVRVYSYLVSNFLDEWIQI